MVAVMRVRQVPSATVSPSASVVPAPSSSNLGVNGSASHNAGISQGALVGAVLIPVILVTTLMLLFLVCKRRKRTTGRRRATPTIPPTLPVSATAQTPASRTTMQRLDDLFYATVQMFTSPSNGNSPSVGGADTGNAQGSNRNRSNNNNTNNTNGGSTNNNRRNNRRGRRERLRRTDSGGTVKTLPEYNELGEDEIMLYKAADSSSDLINEVSVQDAEDGRGAEVETESRGANNNRQGRSPSRNSGRQSSLGSVAGVLRRLSQRRSDSNGAEGNEMTEVIPEEDAPEYSNLYPTLPPQIEVNEEAEEEAQGRRQGDVPAHPPTSRRRAALNNIFRRPAGERQTSGQVSEAHHRRIVSAANVPSANDLDLSMTRSNDLSLYRPSTSTSRRMFSSGFLNNGSSASLLSLTQNSNDSTESPGRSSLNLNQNRQQHIRNISAPISTRRLQFAPPISGFSDQQMQFLTSVESLDRYGIPLEQEADVLPSFEQLARDEERRTHANVAVNPHNAPVFTTAEMHHEQLQMSPNVSLPRTRRSSTDHPSSPPSLPYVS